VTACRRVDGGCSTNEPQGSHTTRMRDNCLKGGKEALCLQDAYGVDLKEFGTQG